MGKLRFIGKDCRYGIAKIISDGAVVSFVCNLDESVHGCFVQGIYISLIVVPGAGSLHLQISIPFLVLRSFLLADHLPADQITILIQLYIVAALKCAILCTGSLCTGTIAQIVGTLYIAVGGGGEKQVTCTVFLILSYQTACCAGRPTVLVIQPSQHLLALCLVNTSLDQLHVLVTQVRCSHTGTHMHMSAAKAHFL